MSFLDKLLSYSGVGGGARQAKPKSDEYIVRYETENIPSSFVAFDFETTGVVSSRDRIIEIGAVKVIDGVLTDSIFSTLVNPLMPIPIGARMVNGITDKMVSTAPKIEQVLPGFLDFVDRLPMIAHNARFDFGFLEAECRRLNLPFNLVGLDTLKFARSLFGFENNKLTTITDCLGIKVEKAHRATDDAIAVAKIALVCKERICER